MNNHKFSQEPTNGQKQKSAHRQISLNLIQLYRIRAFGEFVRTRAHDRRGRCPHRPGRMCHFYGSLRRIRNFPNGPTESSAPTECGVNLQKGREPNHAVFEVCLLSCRAGYPELCTWAARSEDVVRLYALSLSHVCV